MHKGRLEAFSDGVLAIIITIMVLELKVPHGSDWQALWPQVAPFLSYVLSFVYLGIYWNNHHHMFHTVKDVNAGMLWGNLHLLFWLSLFPVSTAWVGETHSATAPTVLYGAVLFMAAVSYYILQRTIIAHQGPNSLLAAAIGRDRKGKLSPLIYLAAIGLAYVSPWISNLCYSFVAAIWLVPDRRIEREFHRRQM